MLTIVYISNREEPHFEWFGDSLKRSLRADSHFNYEKGSWPDCGIQVVAVDFHAHQESRWRKFAPFAPFNVEFHHVPPKPCVWQGPHRLTSQDYFCAANARNTGLCLAPDGWIAYVDDLSFLSHTWLPAVREAMAARRFTLGAYRKVKNLKVGDEGACSFDPCDSDPRSPAGWDTRYRQVNTDPSPAYDSWFFGCSLVGPVEAFLKINGWEEDMDGMGFEDCITGIYMVRSGVKLWYDRRMFTYEDETLHGGSFPRYNAAYPVGSQDQDACWKILREARSGIRNRSTTYPCEIARTRQQALAGLSFPPALVPTCTWQDGRALKDL